MAANIELPIVRIEPAGPVERIDDVPSWQGKFRVPVKYIVQHTDGMEHPEVAHEWFRLKRDAVAFLGTLPREPEHPMRAIYTDSRFWGTTTLYGAVIGGDQ